MILSIGDKVYVDEGSLIGSVGCVGSTLCMRDFLENYKIEPRVYASQPLLYEHIMSAMYSDEKQRRELLMKIISPIYGMFVEHVEKYRKDKFKISKEQRNKEIYNSDVFLGKKSVDLGLADNVGNYMEILKKDFPNAQ